jgi:hypothetical protein
MDSPFELNPFQTVETINESAQQRQLALDLFNTGRPAEWRNRLIWGDKKYVLPALLDEFAGQVELIMLIHRLLVYSKGHHKYEPQYMPYSEEYKKRFNLKDEHGLYFWDNIGAYSQERLEKLKAEGRVRFPDNPNALPRIKNYLHEGR